MAEPHVDGGWIAALLALFGGGGFWAWWTERSKAKAAAPAAAVSADAALVAALGEFSKDVGAGAAGLVAHFVQELKVFSARCDRLEAKNGQLEAKIDECDARHEDCERSLAREKEERAAAIARIRAEFDAYVRDHPAADY